MHFDPDSPLHSAIISSAAAGIALFILSIVIGHLGLTFLRYGSRAQRFCTSLSNWLLFVAALCLAPLIATTFINAWASDRFFP